jgi:hypothetical protein
MITSQGRDIAADPDGSKLPLATDAVVVRFRKLVAEAIAAKSVVAAATQPVRAEREARSIA